MTKQAKKMIQEWRDYEGNLVKAKKDFDKAIETASCCIEKSDAVKTHKILIENQTRKKNERYVRK